MPDFTDLSEVIVYVEEMDRMVAFYEDVLGLEIVEGATEHGFVKFGTSGAALALHAGRDGDLGRFAPKIVFEVKDIGAARDHLQKHGVELGDEIRNPAPGVHVLDGLDPEGNKFAIESHTAPS